MKVQHEPLAAEPIKPIVLPTVDAFDYEQLEQKLAKVTRDRASRIKALHHGTLKAIMEIGYELAQAKEALDHGLFMDWIEREFSFSQSTANNYMNAARAFGGEFATVANLKQASVFRLARAPERVRQEALEILRVTPAADRNEIDRLVERRIAEIAETKRRAKKAPVDQKAEDKKKRAKQRRKERRQQKFAEADADFDRQRSAAVDELLELLEPHFDLDEIERLSELWSSASWTLRKRLQELRSPPLESV